MSQIGRYKIPKEFKDEDKWFKFFTKRQLIYVGVAIAIAFFIGRFFYGLGLLPVGISLAFVVVVIAMVVSMGTMPLDKYLWGGGFSFENIITRLINKKFIKKNKRVFTITYKEIE